jgi:predicted transposase YbfD/YdcC
LSAQSATVCLDEADAWSVLSSFSVEEVSADPAAATSVPTDLLDHFAEVSDYRAQPWVEHPLAAVLALCAGAVVAGMSSFTAIAGWVADVPVEMLTSVYARCGRTGPVTAPSKCTLWQVLTNTPAGPVDTAIGAWLLDRAATVAGHPPPVGDRRSDQDPDGGEPDRLVPVAVDGKTARGAKNVDGDQVHLLAAMTHQGGLVVGQTDVAAKTNEIPMLPVLLDALDLTDVVITADCLHTQRATATYLHGRGAAFVFTVKENQPRLFAALDDVAWHQVPIAHETTDRGHGRITRRTIQVLPAPADLPFPHVKQVFLIERYVSDLHEQPLSAVAVPGVTSLAATRATPKRLAALVRGQWGIESLHWIRDTLYREDASTVRTRSGPQIMAALRNLAIGAHRLAGRTDITEATRWASRNMNRPFQILNLANRS